MSLFSDRQAHALSAHLRTMGESVTHTPRQGAAVSLIGVFAPVFGAESSDDQHSRKIPKGGTLTLVETDINSAAWTLDEDGTFTINSVVYRVAQSVAVPGGHVVKLTRNTRNTFNKLN